jgi:MFS family permease
MLLVLSMVRAVSFFALLPFLPIYLHNEFGIGMEGVGYVLGLCMLGGTLMSVYGGYMVDRFDKLRFMVVLNIVLGALFFVLVPLHSKPAIFLILLLVNIGMSWMNVVGNVMLADLLPPDMRAKAVSLRYALQNIGAAVGPFLGVALMRYDQGAPFFLAAILTLLSAALLLIFRAAFSSSSRASEPRQAPVGFGETLITMRRDRRLVLFTLGGICSMAAYAPYLLTLRSTSSSSKLRPTCMRPSPGFPPPMP